MLSIKELVLLRSVIDDVDPRLYSDDDYQSLQEIRNKIIDLIILQKAWSSGKRIEIDDGLL